MDSLQQQFIRYIARHRLLTAGNKVLTAVSGGIDSMVMLRLLHSAGINCAAAHCNFQLRGNESDSDESFVKQQTANLGIPLHINRFDTEKYTAANGLSIQQAARELRYRWFNELTISHGYDVTAVAHNSDDRSETLFINLARGTGIRGLTSIKPKNGNIIRPLLFASREDIIAYAGEHNVAYREDSSNASDKYVRNYIRHHIIPGLEQYFPGIRQVLNNDIDSFVGIEAFYNEAVERYKQQIVSVDGDLTYIDLPGLMKSPSPPTLLYEIIKSFGFSGSIVNDILNSTEQESGRLFFSDTHCLLCDRQMLIIRPSKKDVFREYTINEDTTETIIPDRLRIRQFDAYPGFKPDTDPNVACLDGDKLRFPLSVRNWQQGDVFRPLGMKNMKKLSDFFIDNKLSLFEKERIRVLISDGQIAWIIGRRIDDRFKITDRTTRVMRAEYFLDKTV